MAYVEAHAGLRDHLKTKKVARALNIPKTQVIGHLLCLWWWCQEYAQDGDLSSFSPVDIAEAAEWPGVPDSFVNALLGCGVKDGAGFLGYDENDHLCINDWFEYGGKLFTKRAQSAQRMRNKRARDACVTRNDGVTVTRVTHIDQIRQDQTRSDPPTPKRGRNNGDDDGDAKLGAVYRCYEENISLLNQIISDDLGDLVETHGAENVIRAIQESARNNGRTVRYVAKVLDNWAAGNMRPSPNGNSNTQTPIVVPPDIAELLR